MGVVRNINSTGRVSPEFICWLEDNGWDWKIINSMKEQWNSVELFELVAKRQLTAAQAAQVMTLREPWWKNWLRRVLRNL